MVRIDQLLSPYSVDGLGTLYSMTVFLVFVNEVGVPELPTLAYLFAVLLYIGGHLTGCGFSLPH